MSRSHSELKVSAVSDHGDSERMAIAPTTARDHSLGSGNLSRRSGRPQYDTNRMLDAIVVAFALFETSVPTRAVGTTRRRRRLRVLNPFVERAAGKCISRVT